MKCVDECNQFLDTLTPIWIWVEVNFRKNNKLDKWSRLNIESTDTRCQPGDEFTGILTPW